MIHYLSSISVNGDCKIYTILNFNKGRNITVSVIDTAEVEDSKLIFKKTDIYLRLT